MALPNCLTCLSGPKEALVSVSPLAGATVYSSTPSLHVNATNPDGSGTLQYAFQISTSTDFSTQLARSGWISSSSWSPPANVLQWNRTYYWQAEVTDQPNPSPSWFSPITMTTAVPQPTTSAHYGRDPYSPAVGGVNPLNGNLTVSSTDATVSGEGPTLTLARTYNSRYTGDSGFGTGWSTPFSMSTSVDTNGPGNYLVTYPDARLARFGRQPDGSYASPGGYYSQLRAPAGVNDHFLRANSATSLGTSSTGLAWTARNGTWGISGYNAYVSTANGDHNVATLPAASDGTFSYAYTVYDNNSGIVFRYKDNSNYWRVVAGPAYAVTLLIKRVNGVDTTVATMPYSCCQTSDLWQVVASGSSIKVLRAGHLETSVTDSALSTATGAGVFSGSSTAGRISVFRVIGDTNRDSFSGANNATSAGYTDSGEQWIPGRGTWGISGNAAYVAVGDAGVNNMMTVDSAPDGTFSFQETSYGNAGLAFRYADADNYWRIVSDTPNSRWKLIKKLDGTDTIVATSASGTCCTTSDTMTVVANGPSIVIKRGNTQIISVADTDLVNGTRAGPFVRGTGSPGARIDNVVLPAAAVLTDQTGTNYTFRSDGNLTTVTDAAGRQANLAYDTSGNLTSVTNETTGRALHFTWSGTHVATVSTDPVAANNNQPYTWTYSYNGNLLTTVKAPGAATGTSYSYTTSAPTNLLSQVTLPKGNLNLKVGYNADGTIAWREDALAHRTTYAVTAHSDGTSTTVVTDPRNNTVTTDYDDQGRLVHRVDEEGYGRSFAYNASGFLTTVTDDTTGDYVLLTTDDHGNTLSRTTPRDDGVEYTSYYSYFAGAPGDPRNDKLLQQRDGRSASAADDTYLTSYSYNQWGDLTSKTTPPTAGQPSGRTTTWTYSTGTETATGGGTVPADVLLTSTDSGNHATHYSYNNKGDLVGTQLPSGLTRSYSYDELGRRLSATETSDSYPAGVTTSYSYDKLSNLLTTTEPAVTNPITGVTHTKVTTNSYDANGNLTQTVLSDATGGDTARTTSYSYDGNDRLTATTQGAGTPQASTASQSYDAMGNTATSTDPNGTVTAYTYTPRNQLWTTTVNNFIDDPTNPGTARDVIVESRAYDSQQRLGSITDALGHETDYTYYNDGLLRTTTRVGVRTPDPASGTLSSATHDVITAAYEYDPAGNRTASYDAEGNETATAVNADNTFASSTLDPGGLNRSTATSYDAAGNPTSVTVSQPGFTDQLTTSTFDNANRDTADTVHNTGGDLTTSYGYDQRGLRTAVTDPRGYSAGQPANPAYTTTYSYDELGRLTAAQSPPVSVEANGQPATVAQPTTTVGYNTYGDITQQQNARGDVTTTSYDVLGRTTTISYPSYTPKGASTAITPTETFSYDPAGNVLTSVDRLNQTTTNTYDKRGRLVRVVQPKPTSTEGNPTIRYTYDDNNEQLSVIDPRGATTQTAYDDLGHPWAHTSIERTPSTANYTTYTISDNNGRTIQTITPADVSTGTDQRTVYDAAGETVSSTDEAGRTTTTAYDVHGQPATVVYPDGTSDTASYDPAGRLTQVRTLDSTGTDLRTTNAGYDAAGNQTSYTDPRGTATTYNYDALNQLISQTVPKTATTSATTSYGYDAAGNQTRVTDPRGNDTITTYNTLGLPEDTIEPSTPGQTSLTDRTFTLSYDAAGNPLQLLKPGDVTVTNTYDNLGRLTSQTGTGAETATTSRSFGYDPAGNITTFSAPGGTQNLGYDDRGDVLTSTGPMGNASFGYDANARLTSRTDSAGTATTTYNPDNTPATQTDPLTGATLTYSYDNMSRLTGIGYGNNTNRTLDYDPLGQLTADTLTTGTTTLRHATYSYDPAGNRTASTLTPTSLPGGGNSAYSYDKGNRLASYTNPANTTTNYSYDLTDNRTSIGTTTASYDARNRLTAIGTHTYSYTARGTLTTSNDGTTTTTTAFDAFDRLITDGATSYSYDALNRLATNGGNTFTYDATEKEPLTDGTQTFARDTTGQPLSVQTTTTSSELLTDPHQDVVATFTTGATTLSTAGGYDPLGTPLTGTTLTTDLGYQSSWTDPTTGKVSMEARFYDPTMGAFISRDSWNVPNRYSYGNGRVLGVIDPTGHWGIVIPVAAAVENAVAGAAAGSFGGPLGVAGGFIAGLLGTVVPLGVGNIPCGYSYPCGLIQGGGNTGSLGVWANAPPLALNFTPVDISKAANAIDAIANGNLDNLYNYLLSKAVAGLTPYVAGGAANGSAAMGSYYPGPSPCAYGCGCGYYCTAAQPWNGGGTGSYTPMGPPPPPPYQPTLRPTTPPPGTGWKAPTGKGSPSGAKPIKNELPEKILHPSPYHPKSADPEVAMGVRRQEQRGDFTCSYTTGSVGMACTPTDPEAPLDASGQSGTGYRGRTVLRPGDPADTDVKGVAEGEIKPGLDVGSTPSRVVGPWTIDDLKRGAFGRPPRSLGSPDLHHAEQMPGSAIHEVLPSMHRGNKSLHLNVFNQGVTDPMRRQDKELHWWYRSQQMGGWETLGPGYYYDEW